MVLHFPGQFLGLFKVPEWVFTAPGEILWISSFQVGFLLFQVGFYGFSRFQVRFSWFQVGFEGKSWLQAGQVGFYSYRSVFHGSMCFFYVCMAPGLVSMISGGFLSSLRVPGLFKSELSAKPAK